MDGVGIKAAREGYKNPGREGLKIQGEGIKIQGERDKKIQGERDENPGREG